MPLPKNLVSVRLSCTLCILWSSPIFYEYGFFLYSRYGKSFNTVVMFHIQSVIINIFMLLCFFLFSETFVSESILKNSLMDQGKTFTGWWDCRCVKLAHLHIFIITYYTCSITLLFYKETVCSLYHWYILHIFID